MDVCLVAVGQEEVGGICDLVSKSYVSRERKVVETRGQDQRVQKGRIMADGACFRSCRTFGSGDIGQ